jgi:transposase
VSNVLNEEKKQQVIALGRLGWSLRKIQKTTGVRRETAADYLRAAGIGLRPPGAWGRGTPANRPTK